MFYAMLAVVVVVPWLAVFAYRSTQSRAQIAFFTVASALTGIAVFVAIAWRIAHGTAFAAADQHALDAIRTHMPSFAPPVFARLTHLGDPPTLTALCAVFCVISLIARHLKLALYLAITTAAGGAINHALKTLMRRERPADAFVPIPESFAFPSGHTFGSIVCYGMCAYVLMRLAPRRWDAPIIAIACALVLLIGMSRVVIGVHFPGDVIGGFAAGGAWLALCIGTAEMARRRSVDVTAR
jgi:membrane-associated phospholipid phosphatase